MRRVNVKTDVLSVAPTNAYIELVQDARDSSQSRPQYLRADTLPGSVVTEVTATADGLTTGLIPASASFVNVTSSVATKQISLPAGAMGDQLQIFCLTNGCELISTVAAATLNGVVVGATNEAALVAGTLYKLTCTQDNVWLMLGYTSSGMSTPVTPDAR
jgi:hypothetical protein